MTLLRLLFLILPVLLTPLALTGQAPGEEGPPDFNQYVRETFTGTPIYWPARGYPPFKVTTISITLDGVRVPRTIFRGPLTLLSNPLDGWQTTTFTDFRKFLVFFRAGDPDVRLQIGMVPKEGFIPEFSKEALGHYAKGLITRKRKNIDIVIRTDFEKPRGRRDPTALGKIPLDLEYMVIDTEGENRPRIVRELFFEHEEAWITVVYDTVEERYQSSLPALNYFLAYLAFPWEGEGGNLVASE